MSWSFIGQGSGVISKLDHKLLGHADIAITTINNRGNLEMVDKSARVVPEVVMNPVAEGLRVFRSVGGLNGDINRQ